MKKLLFVITLLGLAPISAGADDTLARFDGGVGVIPVQGVLTATGRPVANTVRGFPPGGLPWTISRLEVEVKAGGKARVAGHGLVVAGGGSIGASLGLRVRAVLLCGPVNRSSAHFSPEVTLSTGGDFFIDEALTPAPPASCDTPALLILTGGHWLAAGIPASFDTGTRD